MRNAIVFVPLLFLLCGCEVVKHESDVYGRYELLSGRITIGLDVSPDHTYTEIVKYGAVLAERTAGRWHWDSMCVVFDGFMMPSEVLADNTRGQTDENQLHQHGRRKAALSSDKSQWCLSPEKAIGTTRLVVDPDRNINFNMIGTR